MKRVQSLVTIVCLCMLQVAYAGGATKTRTIYVDTPTLCAKVTRVEGNRVYLQHDDTPCAQGTGKIKAEVEEAAKEIIIYVNDKPWTTRLVEQLGTDGIQDVLAGAQKASEKQSFPKNAHTSEGTTKAQDTFRLFQSEEFQQKLEAESRRLQKDVFGNVASEKYYKDNKSLISQGKLSQQERLYVFISSSVPKETLRTYTRMIGKLADPNVILVMRGFIGGAKFVKPTASYVGSLLQNDPGCNPRVEKCAMFKTSIIIDPMLFSKYKIEKVPAFVYVPSLIVTDPQMSEGLESNTRASDYDVLYGSVNLQYILETLQKERKSKGIEALLTALKEGFYNK